MANSAATITIFAHPQGGDLTRNNIIIRGTIKVSAGTYPTHGIPLNWGQVGNSSLSSSPATPWNAQTTYPQGAQVSQGGSQYTAISSNSNEQPPNGTYWTLNNVLAPAYSTILSVYAVPQVASALQVPGAGTTYTTYLPTEVICYSNTVPPSGYIYVVDATYGNLHVLESAPESASSGPLVELLAGYTTPSGVTGDTVQFCAVFPLAADV
jgi:hypothetical protein